MRIKSLPGFLQSQTAPEYTVGSAQTEFLYPGIQQCISLTGHHSYGLLGTHISPGADEEEIAKTFEYLQTGGGKTCVKWYVVGNFLSHFASTQVGWNSISKIVKDLKKNLSKQASYEVFDTSDIASDYSWGIDIKATLAPPDVTFAYAESLGVGPKTFTAITDAFQTY